MADGQSVTFSHPNFGLITVIEWRVDRIVITLEDAGKWYTCENRSRLDGFHRSTKIRNSMYGLTGKLESKEGVLLSFNVTPDL
jgi:hypothetical protein